MAEGSDNLRKDAYRVLCDAGCTESAAATIALALIPLEDDRITHPDLENEVARIQRRFAAEYAEPFLAEKGNMMELEMYAGAALATYRDLAEMLGDPWYYERYNAALEPFVGPPLTYAEAVSNISA